MSADPRAMNNWDAVGRPHAPTVGPEAEAELGDMDETGVGSGDTAPVTRLAAGFRSGEQSEASLGADASIRRAHPAVAVELATAGFMDASVVGRGGFGVVYRCVQSGLGRRVAVKILTMPIGENRARFVREQHAMAQMTGHPNVVPVLHVGETSGGYPFLVMPFCERGSVQDRVNSAESFGIDEVLRLGVKIAGALACAHGVGIVHRDVKPANILFTDFAEPALCDFGIARVSNGDEFVTATGLFAGSPAYTAPEIIGGGRPDPATDVYGLGATLFCCLTGHAAHERRAGEQTVAQLLRIATNPLPDLRAYGVADDIAEVVEHAMARDPRQRPTAAELGQRLQQIQSRRGVPVDTMALPQELVGNRTAVVTSSPGPVTGTAPGDVLPGAAVSAAPAAAVRRQAGGRLPVLAGGLIGRRRETAQLCDMVRASRLVTLVGMGGMGKTTLATHVAAELAAGRFADGVWWVGLADLTDGGLLADVVAAAVGLRDQSGRASAEVLIDYFADRHSLIVVDNCEHMLDEVAKLVDGLLHHCPRLHVLATSRAILDITGETLLPLAPLAIPSAGDDPTLNSLAAYEAVALFLERAHAASPDFMLTADNATAVAQICSQLDGLPLAIELAAARLRALSVHQIADGLSDRFRLLSRGRRGVPSRQQSLTNCISWSHDLCTAEERRLWAQLSVFAGSFVLEAAQAICDDGQGSGGGQWSTGEYFADDLLDQLTDLVDKSILLQSNRGDIVGFRMLDTVREFGRSQLSSTERHQLQQRHGDYYAHLLTQAKNHWWTERQVLWLRRMTMEIPNIRLALQHVLESRPETALQMADIMNWSFAMLGMANELDRWLDLAIAATSQPSEGLIHALCGRATISALQGSTAGRPFLVEARAQLDAVPQPAAHVRVEFTEGAVAVAAGEFARARDCFEHVLAIASEHDYDVRAWSMYMVGWAHMQLGSLEALEWFEKALAFSEACNESIFRSHALFFVGVGRLLTGQAEHAEHAMREGLRLSALVHDPISGALCLEALAWIAQSAHHDSRRAALSMAAAAEIMRAAGQSRDVWLQSALGAFHDMCEQSARQDLGSDVFEAAWAEGMSMDFDQAAEFMLAERAAESRLSPPGNGGARA